MKSFITLEQFTDLIKNVHNVLRIMDIKDNHKSGLVLRHDVDESIDFAYTLYLSEKSIGVKSTFYILLTSDLYNPFSKKNRAYLEKMHIDEFEIGLHFDPLAYTNVEDSFLIEKFEEEIFIFEKTLDIKLHSYSMHQPSVSGKYINHDKLINAYDKELFTIDRYISDSAFTFRGKNLNEYIEKSNHEIIQLLIHPDHLISNGKISYEPAIQQLVKNYIENIDSLYHENLIYKQEQNNIKFYIE
jgi:hypothetical protein